MDKDTLTQLLKLIEKLQNKDAMIDFLCSLLKGESGGNP